MVVLLFKYNKLYYNEFTEQLKLIFLYNFFIINSLGLEKKGL